MTTPIREDLKQILDRGRKQLDEIALDARLLRADLRVKKDEALRDLEKAYADMRAGFEKISDSSQKVGSAAKEAAQGAYETFRQKLDASKATETAGR